MTDTEEITGPTPIATEQAPPDWLTGKEPSKPQAAPTIAQDEERSAVSDIAVDAVVLIHERAADVTGYEKFVLTQSMINLWRKVLRYLLRKMPTKDWPIIICLVSLMVGESMIVFGYLSWKRHNDPNKPTNVPKGERQVPEHVER